jgi:2-polyprenyl-6-methoxyphenol hydroxylase-like FAD-dependent oxidoreductase
MPDNMASTTTSGELFAGRVLVAADGFRSASAFTIQSMKKREGPNGVSMQFLR